MLKNFVYQNLGATLINTIFIDADYEVISCVK